MRGPALIWGFSLGLQVVGAPIEAQRPGEAQGAGRISGNVVDATTGRGIAQAVVTLEGGSLRTITNQEGAFVLRSVPAGVQSLVTRRLGYTPVVTPDVRVEADGAVTVRIAMAPLPFRLAEVAVAPGAHTFFDAGPVANLSVTRQQIENSPFGEDVFRSVSRLPGLTSGDYGAQFSIRGGRQDETLVLLDGLELYEPFHLKDFNEGALSILDVNTIDGVELLTGGFPAHYGDKRSGVMNVTPRMPRSDGARFTVGASLANATALGEGSFAGGRGGWLVSGRRGFFDALLKTINKSETQAPSYRDAFATLRYRLAPGHTVALNLLDAADRYRFTINGTTGFNDTIKTVETADNTYGNRYAWLTLRSVFGEHLTVRTLVSSGRVDAGRRGDERHALQAIELYGVQGHRDFTVRTARQDYRFQPSDRAALDWGFDWRSLAADYDWVNRVTQNPDDPTPDTTGFYPRLTRRSRNTSGTTLGAYVSARLRPVAPLTLELGARHDRATYTGDADWSPRLYALWQLGARTTLRAGWGHYRQRQGIADENAFDRLNRYFPSELSRQWTAGLEHRLAGGGSIRAEAYHKVGSHLRPILRNWKPGLNVFPESSEDRILAYPEATTSRGIELYHERDLGRRFGIRAGYALAKVNERLSRVDNVNDRLRLVFDSTHAWPQDQRHALNADVTWRPTASWTITTAGTWHTGWPYTDELGVPVRRRNGTMDLSVRPDTLWGKRLPSYQRLDVRATRRRVTKNGEFRFFVEAINLTNHENVLGYDVYRVTGPGGQLVLQKDPETWFSIVPSLGVSWTRRF